MTHKYGIFTPLLNSNANKYLIEVFSMKLLHRIMHNNVYYYKLPLGGRPQD